MQEALADLARLRIEVFREFPYLYEGTEEAERDYLAEFAEAEGAVLVVATTGGELVGASTGLPLAEGNECFARPWVEAGEDPREWFYFGESVLRRPLRGRGIGGRFFDLREAHAVKQGFRKLTFCAVERPSDHPLRPMDYRPLDAFWTRRGFAKRPGLVAELGWVQVDSGGEETANRLTFWTRELGQM